MDRDFLEQVDLFIVDAEDYLPGRADLEFADLIPKPDPVENPIVCFKR